MPTGYTADVEDGTVTDFRTFCLRCARAFGATIMQREDRLSDLPKHREPNDYHAKALMTAQAEVKRLASMTIEQAEEAALADYRSELASHKRSVKARDTENARYDAMADKVKMWTPPTPEHRELKRFMLDQLKISRQDWRPSPPVEKSGDEWLKERREHAREQVGYHAKHHAEELARCAEANAWIDALYESLNETANA